MSLPHLPAEIWDRILDLVCNSEESDLSYLFIASILHKSGRYFRLDSIEFEGLNDPKRVLISLNGKNPLSVHFTNLKAALSALSQFLPQTRRVTVVRANQAQYWQEVYGWFEKMTKLSSIILQNSDIGSALIDSISTLPLQNMSFVRCTAAAPYNTQQKTCIRGVSFFDCTPLFMQRMSTRLFKFGNELEEVFMQINHMTSPSLSLSVAAPDYHEGIMTLIRIKEKEACADEVCWRSICALLKECVSTATLAIHITDRVPAQAQLLEILAQTSFIAENEYYTAFNQLLTTPHATVSFGRIYNIHRIFVNGELCTTVKVGTPF